MPFMPFPYHYGSYATKPSYIIDSGHGFHTTMVLTQHEADEIDDWANEKVSIPLWFLRNRFYYKDIIQVLGRQNQPNGKIP